MRDERCSYLRRGEFRAAHYLDAERAYRLLLASLRQDGDARERVTHEVGRCMNCYRGVLHTVVGTCTYLVTDGNHADAADAVAVIEQLLTDVIDERLRLHGL